MSNLVTLRPKPGDVVERVYHVECELWSDSSITLLGAVVPATGKRYALRCWMDSQGAEAAFAMQQFVRAANSVRLFEQPGIVEVFGVGMTNGVFYSVTEWLDGATLENFLERHGRLSGSDAISLLLPCLEGLAVAHKSAITHGDVRPGNVFVCRPTRTEPQRARLAKFDYGRWPERQRGFRRQLSSDLYQRQFVSPEELQGAEPDARSDVYAVGVVLYLAIAGESPFAANTLRELDRAIVTGSWRTLSDTLAGLSPGLADVITRAMALEPEARFQDMAALLTQLAQVEGHDNNALAKYAPESTRYRWITPASQCLRPSLFDLPVLAPDEIDAHRDSAFSRVLRACLVLSLGLLSVTVLHRMLMQPEVPVFSAKQRQRMIAPRASTIPEPAFEFSPLVVPSSDAEPESAPAAPDTKAGKLLKPPSPRPLEARPAEQPAPPSEVAGSRYGSHVGQPSTDGAPVPASIVTRPLLPTPSTAPKLPAPPPGSSAAPPPLTSRHAEVLDQMQLQ